MKSKTTFKYNYKKTPNEETIKSIKESNSDKLEEIKDVDKFMDSL